MFYLIFSGVFLYFVFLFSPHSFVYNLPLSFPRFRRSRTCALRLTAVFLKLTSKLAVMACRGPETDLQTLHSTSYVTADVRLHFFHCQMTEHIVPDPESYCLAQVAQRQAI